MNINKVVRDGKVAVLYSPGLGPGWYTCNRAHIQALFDPTIVEMVEKRDAVLAENCLGLWTEKDDIVCEIEQYAEQTYDDFFSAGANSLEIAWIPEGTEFVVVDDDGDESIKTTIEKVKWVTA